MFCSVLLSILCSQTIYLYSINKRPFQINAPNQINAQIYSCFLNKRQGRLNGQIRYIVFKMCNFEEF